MLDDINDNLSGEQAPENSSEKISLNEGLARIVQEVVEKEGYLLYDFEFTGSGGARTLRVFIDKEGGIGIDDCTQVSRALNLKLDTDENLVPGGAYHLEVSSPGLERSLKKKWHFEKAINEKINFRLSKPLGTLGVEDKRWQNCKHTEGVVLSVVDEGVVLELSGDTKVQIPLNIFEKAKIVFDFSKPKNKR